MLLVDVVMYESNALNKRLTCQTSPPFISLPSTGFWCKLSLAARHCGAQYAWLHGLLPWCFGGGRGPRQCPPPGSGAVAWPRGQFVAHKAGSKAVGGFQQVLCKIFAVISFAFNIISKIVRANLALRMSK